MSVLYLIFVKFGFQILNDCIMLGLIKNFAAPFNVLKVLFTRISSFLQNNQNTPL
jgi:hypothetical protein